MLYDDYEEYEDEFDPMCGGEEYESADLADSFRELRDVWQENSEELRGEFRELFDMFDEYETECLEDGLGQEEGFMKDSIAFNHIRQFAGMLGKMDETVGNFLNATVGLLDGDGPALQIHTESNEKLDRLYKPGDHLSISRGVYTHHAIYSGKGNVIHYSQGYDKIPEIREVPFSEFAGISKVTKLSDEDSPARYSRNEIMKRAHSRLGEQNYNLIYNNCENFVRWCRAGC